MVDNKTTNKKPRAVSIAPSTMVAESVAEWPLHRVVDYLRRKAKEEKDKGIFEGDCRFYNTSGIRMFNTVADELGENYGTTRSRVCRWLSYHGLAIAREDAGIAGLSKVHSKIRRDALETGNRALIDIQSTFAPYAPLDEDGRRTSFYVYGSWVASEFGDLAHLCGVAPSQVAQVYMCASVLTCDLPLLVTMGERLQKECDWWRRWIKYRTATLEIAVALWGSDE